MVLGGRYTYIIIFLIICTIIYFYYSINSSKLYTKPFKKRKSTDPPINLKYRNIHFNKDKGDVFSFIHIQKTGGTTMEKHLVYNIKDSNCVCQETKKPSCMCYRNDIDEIWLVCRYNQPKWPCGLHPDYATLKDCTPLFIENLYNSNHRRRFFYGTILRDPLQRFLSEFRHMQRGASWETAASLCKGQLLMNQIPSCFEGKMWNNLTIEKFITCRYNLAINRQTWMLSNISKIGCNFKSTMSKLKKRKALLSMAKKNLNSLTYFGLLEYPIESQFIFEKTFNLKFKEDFQRWETGFAAEYLKEMPQSEEMIKKIVKLNNLDFSLYKYAKKLFFERYRYFVRVYGPPTTSKTAPKKSKFTMNKSKLERMKKNLPRSKEKEKMLKEKREKELQRLASKNRLN